MVKTGPTNANLVKLIALLERAAKKNKAPIWKRVAYLLSKPTRQRAEVNVSKTASYKGTVLVPGKVLSGGEASTTTIAAFAFSTQARQKIVKAGGKAISIPQLLESNSTGKNVVILI